LSRTPLRKCWVMRYSFAQIKQKSAWVNERAE
jgi:hypothetical protein